MSNNVYNIERINNDAERLETPISCVIELTTQCNWKCKHCYLPEHTSFGLTFEELKKILYDFREIGVHKIIYTGGEIFTRKDTIDIIEFSRYLGFSVSILSNASLINEDIARRLKDCNVSSLSMTVFSMNESVHDGITGVKNSLKNALRGANMVSKQGTRVWIKSPVLKDNMYDIMDVQKYCIENGFTYTSSACIFPRTDGDQTPVSYAMNIDEISDVIEFIDSTNNFEERSFSDELMCKYLLRSFAVTFNGNITPCNSMFLSMGSLRENSIFEIWNLDSYKKIRHLENKKLEKCNSCPLSIYCDRCPATAISEGKTLYSCSSIAKNIAIARQRTYERR